MKIKNIIKFIISITIPLLAGFIGSYFTTPAITGWYSELIKPDLNPPNWIFAPVWTALYILMGISFFLIWKKGKHYLEMSVFGVQIILNTTWSIFFFGFQRLDIAFVNIVLLWIMIFLTMLLFSRISKIAMYLLIPYILWVSFAGYLNFTIWILN
jgi:translocator protein